MDGWSEGKHSALVVHDEPDLRAHGREEESGPRSEDSDEGAGIARGEDQQNGEGRVLVSSADLEVHGQPQGSAHLLAELVARGRAEAPGQDGARAGRQAGAHATGGAHVRPGPVRVGPSDGASRGGAHVKGGPVDLRAVTAGHADTAPSDTARSDAARSDVGHGNAAAHGGGGLGPHSAAKVRAERSAALGTRADAVAGTPAGAAAGIQPHNHAGAQVAGTAAARGGVLPRTRVDEDYMRLLAAGGALIFGRSGLLLYRRRFSAG